MANRFITLTELSGPPARLSRMTFVINTGQILYVARDERREVTVVWITGGRAFEVEESFGAIQKMLSEA